VAIIFLCLVYAQSNHSSSFFSFNLSGIDALKKGNLKVALNQALSDSAVKDTALRLFKLGVINSNLKNESKALFYFRLTAQKNPILAPFAYDLIGDIEIKRNDFQNALNAYRVTMSAGIPQKYKDCVFEKISSIYQKDSASLPTGQWLDEYRQWLLPQFKIQPPSLSEKIDSLVNANDWIGLDTVLLTALQKDPRLSAIISKIADAKLPDSALATTTLFCLSQTAYSFKNYSSAEQFLKRTKSRSDFPEVISERTVAYFEAKLMYASEDFPKAIALFKKYESKFGPEPELLMMISRAYRKLDNDEESLKWYTKHVKLYPGHPKTQEILWLMAWRMELLGKYKEAASYYKKISTSFKDGSRVEESHIRRALCFFKKDNFDSAITNFNLFINKYPASSFIPCAQFWKAKSLLALVDPYDYYANRSRQLMQLLGDTTEYSIDTSTDTSATLAWLDSISPSNAKKTLSSSDSITLYRGLVLLMVGKIKESDFFLEQLEQSFPGNLELQFKLALSYQNYDATMQAFRVARRLTWRIPQNNRSNLPFLVYKLFYPSFYSEAIQRESAIRNIDPFLVSSVIRQESIFNPTIVSPAGAIGLMQIMPYTGKDVARKLGESFTVDSLYLPLTNIRYGARYLRQLLDEFNDNLVLVIAGYNGGPINASRWFDHNKNEDFDLFIEDIEFTETRTYVKKVLSNYWTYRLLSKYPQYAYGAESFEKKDRKYLANQTDE
jgi:tetratricopeptide (TPR) repeat protein